MKNEVKIINYDNHAHATARVAELKTTFALESVKAYNVSARLAAEQNFINLLSKSSKEVKLLAYANNKISYAVIDGDSAATIKTRTATAYGRWSTYIAAVAADAFDNESVNNLYNMFTKNLSAELTGAPRPYSNTAISRQLTAIWTPLLSADTRINAKNYDVKFIYDLIATSSRSSQAANCRLSAEKLLTIAINALIVNYSGKDYAVLTHKGGKIIK